MRLIVLLLFSVMAYGQTLADCKTIPLGFVLGANAGRMNGFQMFPYSSYYHRDVTALTPDANSANMIYDALAFNTALSFWVHYPANGSQPVDWHYGNGDWIVEGLMYYVVDSSTPRKQVFIDRPGATPEESDVTPAPYPIAPYHQGAYKYHTQDIDWDYGSTTDGHFWVIDRDACVSYGFYASQWDGHSLHVNQESVHDLLAGDFQRPNNWTSTEVAGVDLLAGLITDANLDGSEPITHPIMVAAWGNTYHYSWVDPAQHGQYGGNATWTPDQYRIGAIMRLNNSFDENAFCSGMANPTPCVKILQAQKKYGLMPTDGGTAISGYMAAGVKWTEELVNTLQLGTTYINATNFSVVSTSPVYCPTFQATDNNGVTPRCTDTANHPAVNGLAPGTKPSITGVSVSGMTVSYTLSNMMNRISIVTPYVGVVVSNATAPPWNGTVTFTVPKSGTYTITAKNFWGVTTQTVVVP